MQSLRELPSRCALCPRACGADRAAGERGYCGADGDLLIARAALHFWEEPPISGTRGSGTVFFSGCPLRCAYCQNAVLANSEVGRAVAVERLAEIFSELEDKGALNINLVTATHYAPLVMRAIELWREARVATGIGEGIATIGLGGGCGNEGRNSSDAEGGPAEGASVNPLPVVWNSSGYETRSLIESLLGYVDVYLSDFKYASAEPAARYSKAPDYPEVALAALEEMVDQVGEPRFDEVDGALRMTRGVVVRHLLLPNGLEDGMRVVRLVHERFGNRVLLSLMNQYTPIISVQDAAAIPAYELLTRVPDEDYERLLTFADELGVEDYFWQEGAAAKESFIPSWDYEGV